MEEQGVNLNFKDKLSLNVQRFVGWITFPCWASICIFLMRFIGRYRVLGIREVRRRFKQLMRSADGPLLICANHLTKIDSAIINWSLASIWSYMRSFRFFSWNLPERARYEKNPILRFICYLGSCIPVDRGGDRDAVGKAIDKLAYLMQKGHAVTIFPEGKRSVDGKLDAHDFSYGVGRLLRAVNNCQVLCIYLRGTSQEKSSGIPRIGDRFYMDMAVIKPESIYSGLRATRDIASQIVKQLTQMEQVYFATGRQ
jgi:hypothetical protein